MFAQLVARDRLPRYAGLRYSIDRRVVRQVNVFSRLVACEPRVLALLRRLLAPLLQLGLPTANMLAIITGTETIRSANSHLPARRRSNPPPCSGRNRTVAALSTSSPKPPPTPSPAG